MPANTLTDAGPNEVTESPSDGEILLNLIFSMKVRYHIDKTGEPCLLLPGDSLERAYPIQSRRVRAYIAALAWNSVQMLPSTAELDRVLRVLEGLAWELAPKDATRDQLWHSLQDKPILQVVIEFMREREKHEAQMQTLLNDLELVAEKHKFDVYAKQWPKTAAHLSAQLRQEHNQEILKQFGIAIEITRDKNGAKVVLSRVTPSIPGNDEEQSASSAASPDKPQPGNDLAAGDAGDGEMRQQQLEDLILNRLNQHRNHE
ncbi:hypothetical protein [Planctomicrobium sp. SH664]|uniref:hypothetical protein n=1 Tax=Planctomicrobium sp. SH664 TaxID=3448125 RepID=UPI003F5B645F